NSLNHRLGPPFSGRCCVKNTQLREGGVSRLISAAMSENYEISSYINGLCRHRLTLIGASLPQA
ncbi:MAG: hypothetical protein WAL39_18025, partial [Xanthobacteraceae bacterium]